MGGCGSKAKEGDVLPPPPDAPSPPPNPPQPTGTAASSSVTTPASETEPVISSIPAVVPGPATILAPPQKTQESTPATVGGLSEEEDDDITGDSVRIDAPENTNLESTSEAVEDWPLMRYGQLTKQSGSGLVKNWRRRNFTVEKGIVKYYELFINEYPFGEREKGCFALTGYKVVEDSNPREPTQILLQSNINKQFDLLVQADDNKKKNTWVAIFNEHIAYADKYDVKAPERLDANHKTSQRF